MRVSDFGKNKLKKTAKGNFYTNGVSVIFQSKILYRVFLWYFGRKKIALVKYLTKKSCAD